GIAGMAPNLALSYNSQAPDGLAGQGFSLSGTSVIHRCPRNSVQDGSVSAVGMGGVNGDGLCIDGKRLFDRGLVTQPDLSQVRTFEPETQDYTLIRQYQDATSVLGSGSPVADSVYFAVTTKEGQTRFYGARASGNARVIVTHPVNESAAHPEIAMWLLDRVIDQWGNYYDIDYNFDQGNTSTAFSFVTTGVYPTSITYTSHATGAQQTTSPFYTIQFSYENRPDIRNARFGLTNVSQTVRLKEVDIFNTADQSAPLQTYSLTYVADGDISQPSRLNTVQYCPRRGACLPSIKFTWQGGGNTWAENPFLALPGPIEQVGSQDGDAIGLSFTTLKTHGT